MNLGDFLAITVLVVAVVLMLRYQRRQEQKRFAPVLLAPSSSPRPIVPAPVAPVIWVFFVLACVGFAVSLAVHLASWLRVELLPQRYFAGLHVGIFVVWLPAVLVSQRMIAGYEQKDFWKAVLRGAPPWALKVFYGIFYYAFGNFFLFLVRSAGDKSDDLAWRGFSGHWLIFYGGAALMLYSALHSYSNEWVCSAGHLASPEDKFCRECSQPVSRVPPRG